jgi:(+)-trans-carveol dehydrogenase
VNQRFEGKVAFITGAARGQGRSHAVRFAEEGADIIGIDICRPVETTRYPGATPEDLAETVRLVEEAGGRMLAFEADVRDLHSLTRALDNGVREFGRLDVVVANAGIAGLGYADKLGEDEWSEMIDVNLNGVWRTCKAALPHLIAAGNGGSIIMTSSGAGLSATTGLSHYVSAKHGILGLMRCLALEFGPQKIRVNSVHPTNVNTDMLHNELYYDVFLPGDDEPTREKVWNALKARHPLDIGWIEPSDITNAILFLASDEARYITGAALPVDGGRLLA